MIQIIQNFNLEKVWTLIGKDENGEKITKLQGSVTDRYEGEFFEILLDKCEYLAQKYNCDSKVLSILEQFHGMNNIVIMSESRKASKPRPDGSYYYNDHIVDAMPLAKYAKLNVKEEKYVSKFAKPIVKSPTTRSTVVPVVNMSEIERG